MRRILLSLTFVVLGVAMLLWFDAGAHAPAAGEPIGEVQAQLTDGSTFRLAQRPNEVVVINFWATWCAPCRHEVPLLNELHAQGVRVVGLAVDPLPLSTVRKHAAEFGIDYPAGVGSPGLPERLAVQAVPTTFVIGGDGRIAQALRGAASRDELAAAIGAARAR